MYSRIFTLIFFIAFFCEDCNAQCTTLGQNPSTAFPVCGTTTFQQTTVPICASNDLYVPGCSGTGSALYQNKNPFWYKFTCFSSGTLGFVITPIDGGDDYDWQLYDITGQNPNAVYTVSSLVISGNWAGTYGLTGAAAGGVNYIQCASNPVDNKPTFAAMPNLIVGHDYLLLISHFTDSQSGYTLSFGGGSASITDPKEPHLQSARAACDGTQTTIKLNKRMKCNSLTASGSEFSIIPALANVVAATAIGCTGGFDMDSLLLTLDTPLAPGNYTITINNGTDGNTLKDNCDRTIPVGEQITMVVYPVFPTPMDSINPLKCLSDELQLVFRKNIRCSSIAADGTDFVVTLISGTTPVTVIGAAGVCDNNGLSPVIKVKLLAPIPTKGTYQIMLVAGSDGNTIIDECGQETPAGAVLNFYSKDTVNADFIYGLKYGCQRDTVNYFHNGANEVNSWKWSFDNLRTSTLQSPSILYSSFGLKQAQLIVSNGVCRDTSTQTIFLDNELKAGFEATNVVCPGDLATFKDTSTGNIVSWNWNFGNGNSSNLHSPPLQTYLPPSVTTIVIAQLIVTNNLGCTSSAMQKIIVPNNCYIAVPGAFTPNSDGINDYLYPLNAYKAINLLFRVYNRFGQLMFETRDWTRKWDGNFRGQGADPGTYVWILQYINSDTGKKVEQKGTTILIR